MRYVLLTFVTTCAMLSTGCATIVTGSGHTQTVRLNSEPQGATVFVDGNRIGLTPVAATLTRQDNHLVKMSMSGHEDQTVQIRSEFNGLIFGNFLFGGLAGFVIDLSSGAMEGK